MVSRFQRAASLALVGAAFCLAAGARAQTAVAPNAAQAQPAAASAAAHKKKRASTAKTPPGQPPRGVAPCNQADKAQRERCLRDLYGPGAPPA